MLKNILSRLLVAALVFAPVAHAQNTYAPFTPAAADSTTLAVTGTAGNITLPSVSIGPRQIVFTVVGTQVVYVRCDGTAATTGNALPVGPGEHANLSIANGVTTCSAIAATTGSTLVATAGSGTWGGSSAAGLAAGTGTSSTQVQGTAADGAAAVGNPVQIGGVDGSGNVQAVATDTSGNQIVVGNVASGAADSGNPVKVGGKYNTAFPALANGQRGDLQLDANSALVARIGALFTGSDAFGNNNLVGLSAKDDSAGGVRLLINGNYLFNATSWDRQYSNISAVELASAGRTTTQTGSDHTNFNGRGVKVFVNMTVVGTGSITPSIQFKDANGIYYTALTGTAIVTNTTQILTIYPGITAAANVSASDILPRTFRIIITANNANSATYSVAYEIIN